MRGSIRAQILVPLMAVQVVAVAATALVSAGLAADRAGARLAGQLDGVIGTLDRPNFPLTATVLARMRGLSGAEFVACSGDGRVLESTVPGLATLPESLRSLPSRPRVDPPGRSPELELGGRRYLAASVRAAGGSDRPSLLVLYPADAWRRARWDAALPPLAIGLIALAPMAAVTGWVAHRMGERLRSVREQVAAIAAGDFRELDDAGHGDEIRDLVGSVNRMAAQLREMREAIRRTERAGVLAQLGAGLAHQLRNAATGARIAVQLHARRCPGAGSDQSLDVALRQLTLCEDQVKGLLALGRPGLRDRTACDAGTLLGDVARLIEPACRHARVEFSCRTEGHPTLMADAEGVRSALLNLALNAIEAAGPGGRVDLEARGDDAGVRFEVIDDGPGPPPGLESTLFEPFVTGKPEGIGLGLALARRVAVEHGGRLAWSRPDGRTRFCLQLPRDGGGAEGTS
ncbi:sensor histidine kinase [Tundrisphaera sp. TA3]|uniref:sensor histidine kinase n=1 Tax=Tundrisphaera sp. TA3 TaxID=3435775 RepID=UPI003EB9045F